MCVHREQEEGVAYLSIEVLLRKGTSDWVHGGLVGVGGGGVRWGGSIGLGGGHFVGRPSGVSCHRKRANERKERA